MIIAPVGFQDYFYSYSVTTLDGYRLDDANDAIGYVYMIPKDGTITHLGIYMTQKNGTVPDYNIGLVTLDANGDPTTNAYGNSATQTISPSTMDVGWYWIELNTPASSAVQGDIVALHIWPTGTAPTSSNFAEFAWDGIFVSSLPKQKRFAASWTEDMIASSGLQYNDGDIVGFPITAMLYEDLTSTDEFGVYFQLPFGVECNGADIIVISNFAGTESYDVILYNSVNTELASVSITDFDDIDLSQYRVHVSWPDVTLDANTIYRLVVKSTSATSIFGLGVIMQSSAYISQFVPEATTWIATYRTGAGAWTNQTAQVPWIGLKVSEIITEVTEGEGGGDVGFVW